jgi:hypothetical protein
MKAKEIVSEMTAAVRTVGMAICCFFIPGVTAAIDAPKADSAVVAVSGADLNRKLPEIVPGKSTKAQVVVLLGQPWRTVQYNDLDAIEDEIWEYRGTDSQGSFRVHIEFDRQGVVHLVGKIPDRGGGSDGTPARSAPQPPGRNPGG